MLPTPRFIPGSVVGAVPPTCRGPLKAIVVGRCVIDRKRKGRVGGGCAVVYSLGVRYIEGIFRMNALSISHCANESGSSAS